jgi:hypothetical protein
MRCVRDLIKFTTTHKCTEVPVASRTFRHSSAFGINGQVQDGRRS